MGSPLAKSKPAGAGKPSPDELAALTIAQELWGAGNFSPLDEIFEAQALVTSPPTKKSKPAVLAPNVGRKIQVYSKDTGVWLDVFESAPELARFEREKGVKAAFKAWGDQMDLLGTGKFTDVFAFQAGKLGGDLGGLYGRIAKSLRAQGSVFAADTVTASGAGRPQLFTPTEHKAAIEGAGLRITKEVDLSREVMLKIRRGFQHSTEKLAELRKLDGPAKLQMTVAFCTQLERWARIAMQLEGGKIAACCWRAELPA